MRLEKHQILFRSNNALAVRRQRLKLPKPLLLRHLLPVHPKDQRIPLFLRARHGIKRAPSPDMLAKDFRQHEFLTIGGQRLRPLEMIQRGHTRNPRWVS
jgi:hypothetical protein